MFYQAFFLSFFKGMSGNTFALIKCIGMAISINDFRMAIRIDNSEAKIKFEETKVQIASVRAEMEKLASEGKKNSEEYKVLEQKQDELNKSLAEYRKEGVKTALSYVELRKGASQLKREMDRAIPGSEKWKALRQDYLLTKQRMKELEVQARDTRFSLSKVADGFNRYAAIGAGAVASLTGVVLTARKCVDEYAEMQEAEAQVIKYTGMTKEEVAALNEEFKAMDTRTAREKLNALAGDAGRLGITGKKDVLEFVDAADKINVALGEDLGEDAVKNIGKLAQMFGEDEKLGLRGAMLSTGSAINEVAQNSSAAEAYLVGFTARVAGAANQAKVAQRDILGYASVLDQNMQQQEMAATAFQTLMMKMYQEPTKFAKMAGQSVEDFSTLIKKDANEAILQFLETLNKKGGLDQLAPMFKEMGLDGVRASGVISTMAGKIDDIRKAQRLANDAYRDGTSIINEFNVQNNTVQAGLEKAKKDFKDVRVELGEKLQPVMKYMITTGSLTVKGLKAVVSVLFEYKGVILSASVAVAAYTTAVKAQELWTKRLTTAKMLEWLQEKKNIIAKRASLSATLLLSAAKYTLTGNVKLATASMKAFNRASKANLLGLLTSLALGAGAAIYKLATRTSDAEKAVKSFMEQSEKERAQLRNLIDATKAAGDNTKRRKELIEEINTKYGQYLPYLLDEYSSLKDIEKAYREVNAEMDRNLAKKVLKEKTDEIQNESLTDKVDEMNDIRNALIGTLPQSQIDDFLQKMIVATDKSIEAGNSAKNTAKAITKNLEKYYSERSDIPKIQGQIQDYVEVVEKAAKRINSVKAEMNPFINTPSAKKKENVLDEVVITASNTIKGHGGGVDEKASDKKLKEREEELRQKMQTEQNLLKEKFLNEGMLQEKYQQELYRAEMSYLLNRKALLEAYGKDVSGIQGQIYDKMIAESDRLAQAAKAADKNAQSDNLAVLDEEYQTQRTALKQAYVSGDIQQEADYLEQLKELERQYLEERRDMLAAYEEDTSSIDSRLQDMDMADKKDGKEKQREQGFREIDETSSFSQKNNILQAMYDADLISYEEYQDEKSRIAEEREQQRADTARAALDVIGQAASAASQVVGALQDAEISKVTRKYDKQIAAAKKAGKDTTKLEEEKEEAINQVKKKYADKQFAAAVLQVTASTAVAAMEAYKAMAGIPIVGPALGAIAAAAAVASGAAQIAVAKQQRDEAKGLKSGGYSDDYVEGYTKSGNPDDVAGVIPVHKNEFVTNHEGVANPHVRQFLDVFDVAQKNGTIRMLNTTQILEQVRTRSGKYSGGYSEEGNGISQQSFAGSSSTELTPELRSQIVELLRRNNELLVAIRDKDLVVDPRKVRDGIRRVEQLESNVSR